MKKNLVKENAYYDSVTLMLISSRVMSLPGIENAAVMMGTDQNKDLMLESGLIDETIAKRVTANDMVIGIVGESEEAVDKAFEAVEVELANKSKKQGEGEMRTRTMQSAVQKMPDANLTIISVPGRYAKGEAMKALDMGLHVMVFSDNVELEDEIELKKKAREKGLLMMGPDCGTAIINGIALGFANVVNRGDIGIVAGAGTGLQEVSVIIDRNGAGVSQGIGTGGRDLKDAVGGMTMLAGIEALIHDDQTKVILIVSKPASEQVTETLLEALRKTDKPKVICVLGGDRDVEKEKGFVFVETLEDAAIAASQLSRGETPKMTYFSKPKEDIVDIVEKEVGQLKPEQKYVRGLYAGGTLTYEAMLIMRDIIGDTWSNTPLKKNLMLEDVKVSKENTVIDMGDDEFTNGRPHPMIDTRLRVERIRKEASDPEVAVILLDCVIGYGSHEDPAGALQKVVGEAREIAKKDGRHLTFVASVCGTENDLQVRSEQEEKLRSAGILVMDSNAQAARLAALITNKGSSIRDLSWEVN